jgi:hypothetical protein
LEAIANFGKLIGGTSVFLRRLILIATLAGASAAHSHSAESQSSPGVSDTQIKIGQTIAYSGPASSFATIGRTQAAYYRMVNDAGGVNGRKIDFVTLDDGYSPPKTVEQTRRLVGTRYINSKRSPAAGLVVKLLEPLELGDHLSAGWGRRAPVALGTRALPKDFGKARLGRGLFAGIVRGGDDQLANYLARTHDAIVGNTAAVGITQQVRAGLGDPCGVGRRGGPARGKEERSGGDNRHRTHGKLDQVALGRTPEGFGPIPSKVQNGNFQVASVTFSGPS